MDTGPIDEQYLKWLYAHIGNTGTRNISRSHWVFARQLYKKEFVWLVPNDDNRIADGLALRRLFLQECDGVGPDPLWETLGCSMLEMLIALAHRLEFITGDPVFDWFWILIENLGLSMRGTSDRQYSAALETEVDDILDRIIWRTYSKTGEGGLFPVPETDQDLRKIELWYQMSAYLADEF